MPGDYVELILEWQDGADANKVENWLRDHGLSCMKMKSGLLISGNEADLSRLLSVAIGQLSRPSQVPVPPDLLNHVKSITLPRLRHYQR